MNENTATTRAAVSALLAKSPIGETVEQRNTYRTAVVKQALSVEEFSKIESDLPSYPEWETEDAP